MVADLGGDAEERVERDRAREAEQQDRTPADTIGETAPPRREQKLHERERRHEDAEQGAAQEGLARVGKERQQEIVGVEGQERQDDTEAEQIDEDDEEDEKKGGTRGRRTRGLDTG